MIYYQDEAVTLFHGDCLTILPTLAPVDHVITDPPYGRDVYVRAGRIPTTGSQGGKIHSIINGAMAKMAAGDIGSIDDLIEPVGKLLGGLARRWCVVFSDVESCDHWRAVLSVGTGLRYVRTGAWVKPDAMPQMTGDRPGTGFEPCTICHTHGPMRWNGGGSLAVWTHFTSKGEARPDHPCPKPLSLMVELVTLFTDEGETILDPFAGSSTTGVAAKLNGRKAILIERDERYCEISAKRLMATEPGRLFDAVRRAKPMSLFAGSVQPDAPQGVPVEKEAEGSEANRSTCLDLDDAIRVLEAHDRE